MNGQPVLIDLYCKAGGTTRGYQRADFYVIGVDKDAQPHYCGEEFVQSDAITYLTRIIKGEVEAPAAIHASPPCQAFIRSGQVAKDGRHADWLTPTRAVLELTDLPWVIENVPGAPMRADLVLCGSMFGLGVRRHRWFETNLPLSPFTLACDHSRPITGVYGHPHGKGGAWRNGRRPMLPSDRETWEREMDIDWMEPDELGQAIPPAFTEHVGHQLMSHLKARVVA